MATIVKRAVKGAPLTHDEVDANFDNLNTELTTKIGGMAALLMTIKLLTLAMVTTYKFITTLRRVTLTF